MFFGTTTALHDDAVIDCLIKCAQLAPAVDHSPALNRPCLRAWTQLTYFLPFFYQFSLLSSLSCEQNFLFRPACPKRQGSVNNLRVTLVLNAEQCQKQKQKTAWKKIKIHVREKLKNPGQVFLRVDYCTRQK